MVEYKYMTETKPNILVVEDDASLNDAYKTILSAAGYDTRTAFNGEEALKLVKEQEPDIIFLDINMPKMNGIQCLPELKKLEHLKSARIVVYSTTPNEIIKRTTQELGADEFLVKPTRIGLLVDNLSRILETNNV